jgi:hypothetical protein
MIVDQPLAAEIRVSAHQDRATDLALGSGFAAFQSAPTPPLSDVPLAGGIAILTNLSSAVCVTATWGLSNSSMRTIRIP